MGYSVEGSIWKHWGINMKRWKYIFTHVIDAIVTSFEHFLRALEKWINAWSGLSIFIENAYFHT